MGDLIKNHLGAFAVAAVLLIGICVGTFLYLGAQSDRKITERCERKVETTREEGLRMMQSDGLFSSRMGELMYENPEKEVSLRDPECAELYGYPHW